MGYGYPHKHSQRWVHWQGGRDSYFYIPTCCSVRLLLLLEFCFDWERFVTHEFSHAQSPTEAARLLSQVNIKFFGSYVLQVKSLQLNGAQRLGRVLEGKFCPCPILESPKSLIETLSLIQDVLKMSFWTQKFFQPFSFFSQNLMILF